MEQLAFPLIEMFVVQ